jgi:hypothetical protein
VFEGLIKRPVFLAYQAKQTKDKIDGQYGELMRNLREVNDLEPDRFQAKVSKQVSDFFN